MLHVCYRKLSLLLNTLTAYIPVCYCIIWVCPVEMYDTICPSIRLIAGCTPKHFKEVFSSLSSTETHSHHVQSRSSTREYDPLNSNEIIQYWFSTAHVCVRVQCSTPQNCSITAGGSSFLHPVLMHVCVYSMCACVCVCVRPCSCPTCRFSVILSVKRGTSWLRNATNGSEALRWETMHWFPEIIPITWACTHSSAVTSLLTHSSAKSSNSFLLGGASHNWPLTHTHEHAHRQMCRQCFTDISSWAAVLTQ